MVFPLTLSDPRFNLVSVKKRSDRLINYFLAVYFILGLVFASLYNTWLIALTAGSFSLITYYTVKIAFPRSSLYQYVLSVILGIFMAQFIYQMDGMFEMHFFYFIGSALLITYQKWQLQLPILIFLLLHHVLFRDFQDLGLTKATLTIHVLLAVIINFICGLWAFQLNKYQKLQILQTLQLSELKAEAELSLERRKNQEALEERNTILESIDDAFFAVDRSWVVSYWNQSAEKVLGKSKAEMLHHNLWDIFSISIGSLSYQKYHHAIANNEVVHFEDFFEPLNRWYEISAYPSTTGLSVYFTDITERKQNIADLQESEKRYSDVFHFSPLPMWVVDLDSLKFMDVNQATVEQYGYSREEFLTMTLEDIRPHSELPNMEKGLEETKTFRTQISHLYMVHQKKSGDLMDVEIQIAPFQFKGLKTNIVIAVDITERLKYIKAIEEHNEKLVAISWMQSHVVRAPLARIMGLIPLIANEGTTHDERVEMLDYLLVSAEELDDVITNITDMTK